VKAIARVYNSVDAGAANWLGEVIALPADQLPPALRREVFDFRQQYEVDSSRIRRELGYSEIVPFDEALRRTIAWERANHPVE
jgi:nucleoside-diphosphate-sugar epimerase